MAITAEENRRRVKESMERTGTEKITVYMKKGTLERIKAQGKKPSAFGKEAIEKELKRLEK